MGSPTLAVRTAWVLVKEQRDGGLMVTTSGKRRTAAKLLLLGALADVLRRSR